MLLSPAAVVWALDIQLESDTIFRFYERTTSENVEEQASPVYEYLSGRVGDPESISFNFHGWGRFTLGEESFFDDKEEGEVVYGYLQLKPGVQDWVFRVGRQAVFTSVANEYLDGLRVYGSLPANFSFDIYGGLATVFEDDDGRSGDGLIGGRLGHRMDGVYDIGVAYKKMGNDGDKQSERFAVDTFVNLPFLAGAGLSGYSVVNLISDGWAEHSYEVSLPFERYLFQVSFNRFNYEDYFDEDLKAPGPFRFLSDSDEVVTQLEGRFSWWVSDDIDLSAQAILYDYDVRDESASFISALLSYRGLSLFDKNLEIGGELGAMTGDTDDNRYTRIRGYAVWEPSFAVVSADCEYVAYEEEIYRQDYSVFASLSLMRQLTEDFSMSVSADASSDPYFDEDYRGLVVVKYVFD